MATVLRAIQEVTTVPLSFDFPSKKVQEVCLQAYDPAKAHGALPLVNSITEHRWDLMELYGPYRFKVILMASERVEAVNGAMIAKGNKSADEIYGTARRCALRLMNDYGMPADDIIVDMSVSAIIADTEGLNRSTVEAIRLIGQDPALQGVHMMGGLSNIGQQLPPKAVDGSDLKHALECAFLTLTVPLGFDTVLGTPWRGYDALPAGHYVLTTYQNFLQQTGSNALRAVRKFYKA
jgi:5-methyltetrahydrofolate--homocysteine methyltransferase